MKTRRLEFSSGASNKFWEITVTGKSYTIRYGRIGYTGQQRTTKKYSEVEARTAALTLVSRKLDKGYNEVGGSSPLSRASAKKNKNKKPIRPRVSSKKPVAPKEPQKSVAGYQSIGSNVSVPTQAPVANSRSLKEMIDNLGSVDLSNVFLVSPYNYRSYNHSTSNSIKFMKKINKANPAYKRELLKYKNDFARYQELLSSWEKSNVSYEAKIQKYEHDLGEWQQEQDFIAFQTQKAMMEEKYGEKAVFHQVAG